MKNKLSIATIAIVVIVGLTSVLLGVAGAIGYVLFKSQELSALQERNEAIAEQAATGLALPLWNVDESQIRKTAESVMKMREVRAISVRDPKNGRILIALTRDRQGRAVPADRIAVEAGEFSREKDVEFGGEPVGRVAVVVTPDPMEERLGAILFALGVLVLLVIAVLSAALYYTLGRMTLEPIRRLEQYSVGVHGGSFQDSNFQGVRFHGELESLRLSIVKMVSLLETRYQELQAEARRTQESEERFRTLVNTIPDLIWLKDVQGVYLGCNRMFERFFGATEKEILGKTDYDFVAKEVADAFRRNDRKAAERGVPTTNEEWVVFADDGHHALFETTKTPMRNPEGELVGVLGVGRDITQRRRDEEERRLLDERMNNLQKLEALGVLVAGVSHNINNVLAAIMGTASLRAASAENPGDAEAYQIIVTACKRGRDVVKSLVQFSKPTLSTQVPINLHALLAEVRILLENTTLNRVEIVEEFAAEPLWIQGDVGSINHCFMNLCLNSVDAMPEGGTITLRTAKAGPELVEISVEDTGEGIPPEVLARVTEPFFTTKEVGKGTGLGLSMTHGVIKAHGGTIDISSEVGRGTTVKVRLPLFARHESSTDSSSDHDRTGALRILLVDDDQDIRFLVARMLKSRGHAVETCGGGREALDHLATHEAPDVVVMDQNMPGLDGIATLAKLRETHPTLPVLISSGQPDIQDWECFQSPNVGVLSKPFDMAELVAKLSQMRL